LSVLQSLQWLGEASSKFGSLIPSQSATIERHQTGVGVPRNEERA